MSSEHEHSWQYFRDNNFVCRFTQCQLVSDIDTIVAKAKAKTEYNTKVAIYSKLLFDKELKADVHRRIYAWVKANTPEDAPVVSMDEQRGLFA